MATQSPDPVLIGVWWVQAVAFTWYPVVGVLVTSAVALGAPGQVLDLWSRVAPVALPSLQVTALFQLVGIAAGPVQAGDERPGGVQPARRAQPRLYRPP